MAAIAPMAGPEDPQALWSAPSGAVATADSIDRPTYTEAFPSYDEIIAAAERWFPEEPRRAAATVACEIRGYPVNAEVVFDTERSFGGPMQIHRASWERYFLTAYGWTWPEVVLDLDVHFAAAREIRWETASGWRNWPVCAF